MSKYLVLHFLDGSNVRIDESLDKLDKVISSAVLTKANFIRSKLNIINLDYLISVTEVDSEEFRRKPRG
ncbi:MAG: hypothetical protein K2M17_05605 [Bacilli bacterium]|nr:hypothetical protein [Bacilli bacterium]